MLVLDGLPFTRMLERDGKPLPAAEQRKQQQKLDKDTAKLASQTPEEKQRRAAEFEKSRRRERAFLLEIPDAFDFRLEGGGIVDGQDVWVISGVPKPGYRAKSREGAALLKIHGKMWIDKAGYQWVRVEMETIETISFGLFLARLNSRGEAGDGADAHQRPGLVSQAPLHGRQRTCCAGKADRGGRRNHLDGLQEIPGRFAHRAPRPVALVCGRNENSAPDWRPSCGQHSSLTSPGGMTLSRKCRAAARRQAEACPTLMVVMFFHRPVVPQPRFFPFEGRPLD